MTPEGKIKAAVNKVIAAYGADIYKYMPVPAGYGPSSLDYVLCIRGLFVVIETKVPGKKLTPRQHGACRSVKNAGGKVFIVDDMASLVEVNEFFNWIAWKPRSPEAIKAWPEYPNDPRRKD